MHAVNSPGVLVPACFLPFLCWTFVLAVRSARLLRNVFSTWNFRRVSAEEVQIRPRTSLKNLQKRLSPVYGALTYNSVQYEMPPIVHLLQILTYFLLVWGLNFYIMSVSEAQSYAFGVLVGLFCTIVSIVLCIAMHDAFVKSFNKGMLKRETEIKVADNSTILEGRVKELQETNENNSKGLILLLVLTCMAGVMGGVFSLFASSTTNENLFVPALICSCISWALDLPIRILIGLILLKFRFMTHYESEFTQLQVEIKTSDITWLRIKENFEEDRIDSFPNQDVSANYSPNQKSKSFYSCDIMVPKMSPIESEPEQEVSEKLDSFRSASNTLASHNVNSEDENFQSQIIFKGKPKARSPIKSKFSSPVKYQSPVKKKTENKAGFMLLYEVSMDNEPCAELSRDYLTSDQDEKFNFKSSWNDFVAKNCEEEKKDSESESLGEESFIGKIEEADFSQIGKIDEVGDEEKKGKNFYGDKVEGFGESFIDEIQESLEKSPNKEKMSIFELNKPVELPIKTNPDLSHVPSIEMRNLKGFSENHQKTSIKSSINHADSLGHSGYDSFEKSENFPVTEDYRADNEADEDPVPVEKSPKKLKYSKKLQFGLQGLEKPVQDEPLALNADDEIMLTEKLQKLKKNSSLLSKKPKIPKDLKPGNTLISLHRKLISFEEDLKDKPTACTQLVSPLFLSGNDREPIELRENLHFQLNPSEISKPTPELTISSSPKQLITPDLLPETIKEDSFDSEISSSSSSSSFESLECSPKPALKILNKASSKKLVIKPAHCSNDESEEYYLEDIQKQIRAKSGDERRSRKPPSRASKSKEHERGALTSAEMKKRPDIDSTFLRKMTQSKELIKDKKVFDKKNNKKILNHIEKLLQGKENDYDAAEISKLKAMLASRQSFKRKHVEQKDTPYSQKIPTIFSDTNTPNEEFKLDSQAMKKREERLKRISSIYSSKKSKSKRSKPLSPSKSENFMRKNSAL